MMPVSRKLEPLVAITLIAATCVILLALVLSGCQAPLR